MNLRDRASFTLIELLVVIAILAVLATAVVLVLNPTQLIAQGRDSTRLSDLAALNSALSLFTADQFTQPLGTASTTYVSLPDSSSTCGSWSLPILPSGWSYHCVPAASSTKVDGTGWIPVNLTLISSGSPLSKLPIDPINSSSTGLYYTYTTSGGKYELTASMESQRYGYGGSNDVVSTDGGLDDSTYEVGSSLSLLWSNNLMINSTYRAQSFTGWDNPTPSYLTWNLTSPGNGFNGQVLEFDATGGNQSQRSWTDTGAMTQPFVLNNVYKINFFYRANGQFQIHDRDSNITNVSTNTGNASYFSYIYLKTSNAWGSPYFLVYLGNSATVSQVQMYGLQILQHN